MLLKKNDPITNDYDVIIIGAGLGGMTAANVLAKNNKKVLLLEAHNKLGGFATWFYRQDKNHIFDISLHGFPVGMIKTCKKYWNQDIANDIIQLKSVRFVNPQFNLETTFSKDNYTEILVNHFKIKKETVDDFFNTLSTMNFFDDSKMTNKDLFSKFFPNRNDIWRFLMEPIVYANGSTLEDPAITYGIVFSNFMNKGVYTFKGTTEQLINKMKDELLKNNVDIKLHTKIDKISIENKSATGVVADGKKIKSKVVLSNANLLTTINKMCEDHQFDQEFAKEVKKVRLNSSSCQVYMGLKKDESFPFIGDLIFTSSAKEFDTDLILKKDITSRTFSIYYPTHRAPHDRYAIVSSTNAKWSDWANLSDDDYEKEKNKMIEETLNSLNEFIPNIRNKIDYIEAATPITVKKYTHHENGSSFGTKFEGLKVSQDLPAQVKGLFHTGSVGIIMSGWLGAANYGVIVANNIESYLNSK